MSARYVYEGGGYKEFRGYVFWNCNPVTIRDRATLEAIKKEPGFTRIEDEKVEEAKATEAVLEAPQKSPELVANACPKCGRRLNSKGAHFHIRACKA